MPEERATGGGGSSGHSVLVPITASFPGNGAAGASGEGEVPTQWIATGANSSGGMSFVQAYVICSSP